MEPLVVICSWRKWFYIFASPQINVPEDAVLEVDPSLVVRLTSLENNFLYHMIAISASDFHLRK